MLGGTQERIRKIICKGGYSPPFLGVLVVDLSRLSAYFLNLAENCLSISTFTTFVTISVNSLLNCGSVGCGLFLDEMITFFNIGES